MDDKRKEKQNKIKTAVDIGECEGHQDPQHMASKLKKRKGEDETREDDLTPAGKKSKPTGSAGRTTRRSTTPRSVPVFVVEDIESESEMPVPAESPTGASKPPSAEEFKAMLREGLANVAKKEQLDRMMLQIRGNSEALLSLERKVHSNSEATESRFRSIEKTIERGNQNATGDWEASKRAAFQKSRRSMRIWPIAGDDADEMNANFRDFAVEALQVPDTTVRNAAIEGIVRVRSSPQSKAYMEILITFSDHYERDFYYSKAKNLAEYRNSEGDPTAGIRLDIPPYLMSTFKLLSDHGYEIRKANGVDTKRYIKYDDENLSLILEIRLPGQTKWIRIRPDQARSFSEEKDRAVYNSLRSSLMRTDERTNPNMIPLGDRTTSRRASDSSTGTIPSLVSGQSARWVPPPRESNLRGNQPRNSQS